MNAGLRAVFLAALAVIILTAGGVQAHQVKLYAYVEGGQLKGEGYMPGGGKIKNSPVEVYDANGRLLAKAKTGGKGAFSLPLPQGQPPFKLVLKAGPGHRGEYVLSAADLGAAAPQARVDEGVTVRSVVEGLGIILALAGLAFYFRSLWEKRKKKKG